MYFAIGQFSHLLQDVRPAIPTLWWLGPIGAIAALFAAFLFYRDVNREEEGTPLMIEIAQAVREGAMAYLSAQFKAVSIVFVGMFIFFVILAFVFDLQSKILPFAFLTAGAFSGAAGYVGMKTATNASARTANAAGRSLNDGLRVAFRAGAVMGLSVVGFVLLDMSVWFLLLYYVVPADFYGGVTAFLPTVTTIMLAAAVGASTMALFGRVGGGIYTKAADVGADLVGKVEAGIPEDDPRNPATIADNVGDNVGDVAGMGADLYESYSASILATASLGVAYAVTQGLDVAGQLNYIVAPVMLAGAGVLLSILGVFLVRAHEDATMKQLIHALERSIQVIGLLIGILAFGLLYLLGFDNWINLGIAVATGIVAGVLIGRVTERYTSAEYGPTNRIVKSTETGPATVIISGLAVGMESVVWPIIIIVIASGLAFFVGGGSESTLGGLFAVGMAAVGMLSTLGLTLATDAYGPVADNAGGNAEMAGLPPEVRERTDQLDALGNTTAATGKGFAIGSAALTGLALVAAYIQTVGDSFIKLGVDTLDGATIPVAAMSIDDLVTHFNVTPLNPAFLFGMFIGAMTAFFFCSLTMSAVGRAAGAMVDEVRRQFREMPGIMTGEQKPDYAECVEISTQSALREMRMPSILAILVPIVVGVLFGVPGVLGLLVGGLATGFALAIMMANSGGAWDNAKKAIEAGAEGGKGSEAHKAAVVGDTVGDPFKDTSGPSLNILIKLMSIVSVVLAALTAAIGQGFGLLGLWVN